jgi:hypothetical protein
MVGVAQLQGPLVKSMQQRMYMQCNFPTISWSSFDICGPVYVTHSPTLGKCIPQITKPQCKQVLDRAPIPRSYDLCFKKPRCTGTLSRVVHNIIPAVRFSPSNATLAPNRTGYLMSYNHAPEASRSCVRNSVPEGLKACEHQLYWSTEDLM